MTNRYTRTRWGASLESLGQFAHPIRIGDVLILPIGALNARKSTFLKVVDWALGRNHTPLSDREDCVQHSASPRCSFLDKAADP